VNVLAKIKYPKKEIVRETLKIMGMISSAKKKKKSSSPINRGAKRVVKHVLVSKE
jgi:hypothetical protein